MTMGVSPTEAAIEAELSANHRKDLYKIKNRLQWKTIEACFRMITNDIESTEITTGSAYLP